MRQAKFNFVLMMTLTALAFVGCSIKPKEKQSVSKVSADAYLTRATFEGKMYHFVRGIEEADSDNTAEATPGMSTDFGLVKIQFTEDSMQFVQAWTPNGRPGTMSVIASFPVTYFDITTELNDFNEKTNHIIEDSTTNPWNQRQYIRVTWNKNTTTNSSFIHDLGLDEDSYSGKKGDGPSDSSGASSGSSHDFVEENTELLEDPKFDADGHFSFLIKTNIQQPGGWYTHYFPETFQRPAAYSVTYRSHLIPVKPSDFQPLSYSLNDFQNFGYFFTQQDIFDPEKGLTDQTQKIYANVYNVCEQFSTSGVHRGSCETNRIRWVLSKGFPEEYKQVARQVIGDWNKTFQDALKRQDDVVYLDETVQSDISDLRNNILAYYPSRTQAGLLGVAQSINDPRTGEQVGARATIYGDGINYEMNAIDLYIDLLTKDPLKDILNTAALGSTTGNFVPPSNPFAMSRKSLDMQNKLLGISKIKNSSAQSNLMAFKRGTTVGTRAFGTTDSGLVRTAAIAQRIKDAGAPGVLATDVNPFANESGQVPPVHVATPGLTIPSLGGVENVLFGTSDLKAERLQSLNEAQSGVHGTEFVDEAVYRFLMKMLADGSKPSDLDAQRAQIKAKMAQLIFYTTALHEMGHCFGLRHNFKGSADKAHYYPEYAQLAQKLAAGDPTVKKEDLEPFASSSIMDYGADLFSQKGGLGPYDKAAIGYAYNRSTDRAGYTNLPQSSKFAFCTDHQVNEDIMCRRFDKGANISEITANLIEKYRRSWALSHFRRDNIAFRSSWRTMYSVLGTYMIPIRQVMDEFIYTVVQASNMPASNPGAASSLSLCGFKFVNDSVAAGEIGNVCDPIQSEAFGTEFYDLESYYSALYDPVSLKLKKDPSQYVPGNMADLLYANKLARDFFQEVLGAPEPGSYLVQPNDDPSLPPKLVLLTKDTTQTDEQKLSDYAAGQNITDPAAVASFIAANKKLVTDVTIGRAGRPLESTTSQVAGFYRTESAGYFWDKLAALVALSSPGVGVEKYDIVELAGNGYAYPQTAKFTTRLFGKMIGNDPNISLIPVVMKNDGGKVGMAVAPASFDIDTQAFSTMLAISNLTSKTDSSFADKLRICNANEHQCDQSIVGQVVTVPSSSTGDTFKASQTLDGDSIAFDLLTTYKQTTDDRAQYLLLQNHASGAEATALQQISASSDLHDRIVEELSKVPELASTTKDLLSTDPDDTSDWFQFIMLVKSGSDGGLLTNLTAGDQIQQDFANEGLKIVPLIQSLGTAGICPTHPVTVAAPPAPAPHPTAAGAKPAPAQTAVHPATVQQVADPACLATAPAARRAALMALKTDYIQLYNLVKGILDQSGKTRLAGFKINNDTNSLKGKEAQVQMIREILTATGGQ